MPAVDTVLQLGTRPLSTPVPRQEWAEALCAVLAPDARRVVRIGRVVRLVRGLLDANALVGRLDSLFGPGVHLGAVEEHGCHILELVISVEIANLELESMLQMYREHVSRLDECLHEFRQSQELPYARATGHALMDAFYFVVDSYVFIAIIVLLCLLLCFNVCTLFSILICSASMCVYTLSILYIWMVTARFKLVYKKR